MNTLRSHKLALYTSASREQVQDAISFDQIINGGLTEAVSFVLDDALFNGNGVAKPNGVLNDPAIITVNKESNQDANTILYNNIVKMMARLVPGSFNRSIFIANQTAIPQLLTMTLPVGTGGAHVNQISTTPVMRETDAGFTILGRPVLFSEKLPALGSSGDIILVDLSQYFIGQRAELIIEQSNAVYWLTDKVAYRAILRADGQGSWNSAITPKNGSSLSWCVKLQARSS